ncbi:MAG: DUF3048 domain-containing protein [Acidimicrobiales bacterium]
MTDPDAPEPDEEAGASDADDRPAALLGDADGPADETDGGSWWARPRARLLVGAGLVAALLAVIVVAVLRSGGDVTTLDQAGAEDHELVATDDTDPPGTAAPEPPATEAAAPDTIGTTTTTRKPRRPGTGPPGPLTNQAVDYPGYERRGALVVKIDNLDPDARPQAGITLADVVFEERVEGNITRFAAVFHGSDSEEIGPVRSGRSTDLGIVGQLNRPLYAFSGANGAFLDLLRAGPLVDIGADARPGAYYRTGGRVIPHNLFTSTGSLYRQAGALPPYPLWPFRPAGTVPAGARPVVGAALQFGGGFTRVVYRWDPVEGGGAFVREQNGSVHYDTDNWPVAPQNVVIQFVDYVDSGVPDGSGHPIPEARMIGRGNGWLLTGGAALPITWERDSLESATRFLGPDGSVVPFAAGKTWVELVPTWAGATIEWR